MKEIWLLYRDGELLEVCDDYDEANGIKYGDKYSGHWDSFYIDSFEVDESKIKEAYKEVIKFMIKNQVSCVETIHQCDWVIEGAYDFLSKLYKIVENELPEEYD
ncbi:hypothetical protein [Brevibacillus porteri]|uniref:hypothetical protein n=1 Tax=Brevibacillus porteri TaxID=2126350 RepID=UPI003643DFFA